MVDIKELGSATKLIELGTMTWSGGMLAGHVEARTRLKKKRAASKNAAKLFRRKRRMESRSYLLWWLEKIGQE